MIPTFDIFMLILEVILSVVFDQVMGFALIEGGRTSCACVVSIILI